MLASQGKLKKALFYINTSNGFIPSNPNSLRDMGGLRNCIYKLEDLTDNMARNVTWKDLLQGDEKLDDLMRKSQQSYFKSGPNSRRPSLENVPRTPSEKSEVFGQRRLSA